jgi:sulfur carrier protein
VGAVTLIQLAPLGTGVQVVARVVAGESHELELSAEATYGDVVRAVGFNEHEVTVLVDDRPVPEDAPVETDTDRVLRLVQGG